MFMGGAWDQNSELAILDVRNIFEGATIEYGWNYYMECWACI
jgi:hypothetical protein